MRWRVRSPGIYTPGEAARSADLHFETVPLDIIVETLCNRHLLSSRAYNQQPFTRRAQIESRMQYCSSVIWLVFMVIGIGSVYGDPQPMARPTRPKVFTSPEELRRYLDHVRDYYSLNGKARYGKRAEDIPTKAEGEQAWETFRTIINAHQHARNGQKFDDGRLGSTTDWARDLRSPDFNKHSISLASRPAYLLDVVEKFYDDAQ